MSLINGRIIVTKEMNIVNIEVSNGARPFYMGDVESIPNAPFEFIKVPLLIPDYNALSLLIDGRTRDYERSYINTLSSPAAIELFASILGILYMGGNIVMYFPEENSDLNYSNILLNHIRNVYGITVQSRTTAFFYDTRYDGNNARLLYLYNIIGPVDYVMIAEDIMDVDIGKLRVELAPKWNIPTNVDNSEFVRILDEKKQEMIKYGRLLEPIMSRIEN